MQLAEFVSVFLAFVDPGWVARQFAQGDGVPFTLWTIGTLLAGLSIGLLVGHRAELRRAAQRDRASIAKIHAELGSIPGFERVNSVESLIEKADELRKRPERSELDRALARVADLERQLADSREAASASGAKVGELADAAVPEPTEPVRTPKGALTVGRAGLSFFPPAMARAALEAFDAYPELVEIGAHAPELERSWTRGDGVFFRSRLAFAGAAGEPDGRYTLTKAWADFLNGDEALAELRRIARG